MTLCGVWKRGVFEGAGSNNAALNALGRRVEKVWWFDWFRFWCALNALGRNVEQLLYKGLFPVVRGKVLPTNKITFVKF